MIVRREDECICDVWKDGDDGDINGDGGGGGDGDGDYQKKESLTSSFSSFPLSSLILYMEFQKYFR